MLKKFGIGVVLAWLAVTAARHYAGYFLLDRFDRLAQAAEEADPGTRPERDLLAGVRLSGNPGIYGELGRYRFIKALAAVRMGDGERADAECDRAHEAVKEQIRRNPADSRGWYQMGLVMLLYNYPALTYRVAGRTYLKRAAELDAGNEFICANVVSIFIGQWDELDPAEHALVSIQLRRMRDNPDLFVREIQRQVRENTGSDEAVRKAIDLVPEIKPRLLQYLR